MVYEKSFLGTQEIGNQERALNVKQRQVLILIDGKRTQDDLEKYLTRLNVPEIIDDLLALGFIYDPRKRQNASPFITQAAIETPEISEERLSEVQNILIESASSHLGMMGRGMIEQIKQANSYTKMKSCISRWHMAIRESKTGREIADDLMQHVNNVISSA